MLEDAIQKDIADHDKIEKLKAQEKSLMSKLTAIGDEIRKLEHGRYSSHAGNALNIIVNDANIKRKKK